MYEDAIIQNANIDNSILDFMQFQGEKYIYGNSLQTAVSIGLMRSLDVAITGLVLPYGKEIAGRRGFWKQMMNSLKSVDLDSITDKDSAYILIAEPQDEFQNNYEHLYSRGFHNLIGCCWKHNSDMTQVAGDYFHTKQKGQEHNV
jgi:hypothetical protein